MSELSAFTGATEKGAGVWRIVSSMRKKKKQSEKVRRRGELRTFSCAVAAETLGDAPAYFVQGAADDGPVALRGRRL